MMRSMMLVFCCLMICSCIQFQVEIKEDVPPLPSYVYGIELAQTSDDQHLMCIRFSVEDMWEEGNNPDELIEHIVENLRLSLDGNPLTLDHWVKYDRLYTVFDSHNNVIGYYGGPVEACILWSNIPIGPHRLQFETKSMSNVSHEFDLYIVNQNGDLNVLSEFTK